MILSAETLVSGSSGNAILVHTTEGPFLFDCGISKRKLEAALAERFQTPQDLCGIFITHEHSDHIRGLKVLLKHYNCPLYLARPTVRHLSREGSLYNPNRVHLFFPYEWQAFGQLKIKPWPVSHDSKSCHAFIIQDAKNKMAVMLDLGFVSEAMIEELKGVSVLFIEANYNPRLLLEGPYTRRHQERVRGPKGHLSNFQTAEVIEKLLPFGLKKVMLCHLSKINNSPRIALGDIRGYLDARGCLQTTDLKLYAAPRYEPSERIVF